MSAKERVLGAVSLMGKKFQESRLGEKILFTGNMALSRSYREEWVRGHLEVDLAAGSVSPEQASLILEQSQKSQTSRHFGEAFAIPLASYVIAAASSAYIAYYAWETNDPLAWGYTLSHFAQGAPKLSISSISRATALAVSIGYDHIEDREVGSVKRLAGEAAALFTSGISWVGAGNAGPLMRMGVHSSEFRNYVSGKIVKNMAPDKPPVSATKINYMEHYGFAMLPRVG